mmetsp:Transcript_11896/g.39133  ORF Transcript_11896/g.39133 Transcript_11896/m.39133 type:complete len:122 (+) Transcript_11896:1630-1995(+)
MFAYHIFYVDNHTITDQTAHYSYRSRRQNSEAAFLLVVDIFPHLRKRDVKDAIRFPLPAASGEEERLTPLKRAGVSPSGTYGDALQEEAPGLSASMLELATVSLNAPTSLCGGTLANGTLG